MPAYSVGAFSQICACSASKADQPQLRIVFPTLVPGGNILVPKAIDDGAIIVDAQRPKQRRKDFVVF